MTGGGRRWAAGLAALALIACDDPPAAGPPPAVPLGAAAKPKPVAAQVRLKLSQPGLWAQVAGTADSAEAWVVRAGDGGDPELKRGRLDAGQVATLWGQVDATRGLEQGSGWRGTATLEIERAGASRTVRFGPGEADVDRAVAAIAAQLDALTPTRAEGTTEVWLPPMGADAGAPVDGTCSADPAGITCEPFRPRGPRECYPTVARDVMWCFADPFSTDAALIRAEEHLRPPSLAGVYGAVLGEGVECRGSGRPWSVYCSDGRPVNGVFAGPTRWVVLRDRPEVAVRVMPRAGGLPRPPAPTEGPFRIELDRENGMSMWGQSGALTGDDAAATGWLLTRPGGSDLDAFELRRGRLTPGAIAALWGTLDALGWDQLKDVSANATDTTESSLFLQRGPARHQVTTEWGGKNPTNDAFAAIGGVLKQLPVVKWKTTVAPVPRPKAGLPAVPGRCGSSMHCAPEGGKDFTRCVATAAPALVYCPLLPWSPNGMLLKVDPKRLDANDRLARAPWGARLEGGQRCRLPRREDFGGRQRRAELVCEDGDLVTRLVEQGDRWVALKRVAGGDEVPVPVEVIYFPGARAPGPKRR